MATKFFDSGIMLRFGETKKNWDVDVNNILNNISKLFETVYF